MRERDGLGLEDLFRETAQTILIAADGWTECASRRTHYLTVVGIAILNGRLGRLCPPLFAFTIQCLVARLSTSQG